MMKGWIKMKFEVIYEQVIRNQTMFEIEAENEDALLKALDEAEEDMKLYDGDDIDCLKFSLRSVPYIKIANVNEDYYVSWDAPEYYDHNKVDVVRLETK